ncbi:MAG TPA: hypothetical protein VKT25_12385 [Ktedonobacteraceae bacterium]|nr:hypothetical protein [Ktedonobacteraceae bacterium]
MIGVIILCSPLLRILLWSRRVQRRVLHTVNPPQPAHPTSRRIRPLPLVQRAVGVPVEHLPNPYPPFTGTLRIHDPLRDNSAGYQWMDDREHMSRETEGCHFCEEAYRVSIGSQPTPWMIYCLAYETNFSNFVYSVEATLLQEPEIGLVFRQTAQFGHYYFYVRRNSTYGLQCVTRRERSTLIEGFNPYIRCELSQSNLLAVVADGPDIDLYINHQHAAHVTDATLAAGRISLSAATDAHSPCEASFRNVMLWTLD